MEYKVISTDDHLQEGPYTWTSRMSKRKWGDRIPQVRANGDGTDNWYIDDVKTNLVAAVHGCMPDRTNPPTRWEDVPEIAYVPAERVKAMEDDGVDVHTFFGNIAGIAGNTFSDPKYADEEFRLACIQAANDHQIEEWGQAYPGKFITLGIVPLWSPEKAVAEAYRTHELGIHGYSFAFPQQFGYPHIADKVWDPFWDAAQSVDLPVNLHIGSGGSQGYRDSPNPDAHPMMELAERSTKAISANVQVMASILFSGILERFPRLRMGSAESGLGWVPYLLETSDHQWERQKLWRLGMELKPSDYFRRQCFVNFWYEVVGLKLREFIGIDNIMWLSDFPHPTCTWPTSQEYIARGTGDLTDEERRKILVDNAVKLYHLEKYQD
ncbi:amidohydrolase [Dehalococcoidia bacterium]|nr:amidohydrolase [Dehalococcoidia bacterium]